MSSPISVPSKYQKVTTKEPLLTERLFETLEIENPPVKDDISIQTSVDSTEYEKMLYPSNCFSNLTFSWAYPILKKAKKTQIKNDNIGRISSSLNAKQFLNELKPKWYGKYQFQKKAPLFRSIIRANLSQILTMIFCTTFKSFLEIINVYLYRQILLSFQGGKETPLFPFQYLILLMLASKFIFIFLSRKCDFLVSLIGSKTVIQINSLIYDKILRVATYNKSKFSEGELINFMQIDSEKFGEFLADCPSTLILPFQVGFYVYLLFQYFGYSFLFGLAGLLVMIAFLVKIQSEKLKIQKKLNIARDERMKIVTQTFNMIKTIKLYSWEDAFSNKILAKRENELDFLKKINSKNVYTNALYWSGNLILSLLSIGFYSLLGNEMNTANILTSIYIFNSLADPLYTLPGFFNQLQDSLVSLKRIEKVLYSKDCDTTQVEHIPPTNENAISISKVSFGIDKTETEPTILLKEVDLEIKKGELIAVVGEVGSGKSCLLNAFLNNLGVFSKTPEKNIKINGTISYVSQNPWILNDTIKNNILFFKEMNEEKYKKVIEICELNQDIKLFSGGDMTEIGEKGVGLSGGQRARLAIARAIYSDADIYLFDDPLSALDAYVGMKIFNQVFVDYLKGKTRIIVTHALQYVSYTDRVLYMNEGKIQWFGNANQLETQEFYKHFIENIKNKKEKETPEENEKNGHKSNTSSEVSTNSEVVRITKDEEQKIGRINFNVWWTFFTYAGGAVYLFYTAMINLSWKSCEIGSDYFLTYWTSQVKQTVYESRKFLLIFAGISLLTTFCVFLRAYLMIQGLIRFNIKMFNELLFKLMKAPVNLFHDTIPRGQILSRFGKDLDSSTRLNNISSGTIRILTQLSGSIIICALFNYYILLLFPLVLIIQCIVIKFYLQGGRDLNRLEGNCRSPILGVFSETISGIPIIRAYNYESKFEDKFHKRLNNFLKVKIVQSGASSWFGVHLDLVSFVLLVFILLFSLYFKSSLSPETMGILLSYSIKIIEYLFYVMERYTLLERLLTSVERCVNFTKIVQELPSSTELDKTLTSFPENGKIEFKNYSVKYRPETDLVLKNLNFVIQPGEKVGVVGRTGSGKSTLCLCLFRILEPYSGSITIDDIDISKLGLDFLRKNMTIIPQDPTLIAGTLRENVDPTQEYADNAIIEALVEVGLEYLVKEKSIEYQIVENGNNLSAGERQLICIARATLRKSKIILMDEATSSIDYKTETVIQESISKVMKTSTVITIAHRIKTIINYDKILVLESGRIVEFDSPKELLKKEHSLFSELYKESAI